MDDFYTRQRLYPRNFDVSRVMQGMTPNEARRVGQATYTPGFYGDMVQQLVVLPNGVDVLAVPRPKNTRVMLIIQNPNPNNLFVSFDKLADPAGLIIPTLGSLLFDVAVPQSDIHMIYYGVAPTVVCPVFYINVDITNGAAGR